MLARCRVHEVSQEWGCEWGSSYMNESIHSVSSHDCRFLPSRMRGCSLLITRESKGVCDFAAQSAAPAAAHTRATAAHPGRALGPLGGRYCGLCCMCAVGRGL